MLEQVETIVREVAEEVVLPKFRSLTAGEIEEKSPGELVTVADRASEVLLAKRLSALLPEAQIVGEEAVAADPGVLDRLAGDRPVWLIDPVDGTSNFAAGREPFGIMVALVRSGRPVLGVIYEPVPGAMTVAEEGSGTYVDGVRTRMGTEPLTLGELRGGILTRFLPDGVRERVEAGVSGLGAALPGFHCAAHEYREIVTGGEEFAFFWRSLPWDHAAGALIVREAGGVARRFDGTDYVVGDGRTGLLAARDQLSFELLREALVDGLPSHWVTA
ncbi:inositol monophosphatase family protein [Hamadaea sp. NPDC051192]|uniref:inositol monophosphatase family protein n=1 Tax=Hamadaea sp. NPDC051192 TaxID=3154940 RepID=UPI0034467531